MGLGAAASAGASAGGTMATLGMAANPYAAIPALVGNTAMGVWQMIQGIKQGREYKKLMSQLVEPIYDIPTGITDNLNQAKTLASSNRFAGQTQTEQRLDAQVARSGAEIQRTATSAQDALAAITGLNENASDKELRIMETALQDYERRQGNLSNARTAYAQQEAIKQDRDKYDKFYRDSAAASALRAGQMNNTYQGFKRIVGGGAQAGQGFIDPYKYAPEAPYVPKDRINTIQMGNNPLGTVQPQGGLMPNNSLMNQWQNASNQLNGFNFSWM